MSGSEGGVGKHSLAVRSAPTLQRGSTYGKASPCHVISCIAWGCAQDTRGSDRIQWYDHVQRMTEAGYLCMPAQRMPWVNWSYPMTGRDTAERGMG
jgi:hypothetical protein